MYIFGSGINYLIPTATIEETQRPKQRTLLTNDFAKTKNMGYNFKHINNYILFQRFRVRPHYSETCVTIMIP